MTLGVGDTEPVDKGGGGGLREAGEVRDEEAAGGAGGGGARRGDSGIGAGVSGSGVEGRRWRQAAGWWEADSWGRTPTRRARGGERSHGRWGRPTGVGTRDYLAFLLVERDDMTFEKPLQYMKYMACLVTRLKI